MLRFSYPDQERALWAKNLLENYLGNKYCKITMQEGGHLQNGYSVFVMSEYPGFNIKGNPVLDCAIHGDVEKGVAIFCNFSFIRIKEYNSWVAWKNLEEMSK